MVLFILNGINQKNSATVDFGVLSAYYNKENEYYHKIIKSCQMLIK